MSCLSLAFPTRQIILCHQRIKLRESIGSANSENMEFPFRDGMQVAALFLYYVRGFKAHFIQNAVKMREKRLLLAINGLETRL